MRIAPQRCVRLLATAWLLMPAVAGLADAVEVFTETRTFFWLERDARVGREAREELALLDPQQTGFVGLEWSFLTTSPGYLEAKQAATDSTWVLMFRNWFAEAGVSRGDRVAIGASGSFPAIVLAARLAAEEAGIEPVVIGSLGASNYGANVPDFDLWEMEKLLLERHILRTRLLAISPGAANDMGGVDDPDDQRRFAHRLAEIRAEAAGQVIVLEPRSRRHSIAMREELFFGKGGAVENNSRICLFINIGGNAANHGIGDSSLQIPTGFTSGWKGQRLAGPSGTLRGDSMLLRSMRAGIPVLNILSIQKLMNAYAVTSTFSPTPNPSVGALHR